MSNPNWLDVAIGELSTEDVPVSQPKIIEYARFTMPRPFNRPAEWCAMFVNYCFVKVGMKGTRSPSPKSFLEWGDALTEPQPGCVAVVRQGIDALVGFYIEDISDQSVKILVFDPNGRIKYNLYLKSDVSAYRWPKEIY